MQASPLQRAKQNAAAEAEDLESHFMNVDTVKALFEFLRVEPGDEGERQVDGVLQQQSTNVGGRRPDQAPTKRAISKEPKPAAASNPQPAATTVADPKPAAATEAAQK